MPHFKDSLNQIYWLDDGVDATIWLPQCELISDADADALRPTPIPAPIPPLTPRQIRMALTRIGLRTTVEAAVAAGDQDLKDWWEWSQTFERLHPAVVSMGDALSQSAEQLDALWALGAIL